MREPSGAAGARAPCRREDQHGAGERTSMAQEREPAMGPAMGDAARKNAPADRAYAPADRADAAAERAVQQAQRGSLRSWEP